MEPRDLLQITVRDLLEDAATRTPNRVFLFFGDRSYTYAEIDRYANQAANAFLHLGVRQGARVAAVLPNSPEFLFVWFGLAKVGAALAAFNPASTRGELAALLAAASPDAVVAEDRNETEAAIAEAGIAGEALGPDELLRSGSQEPPSVTVGPGDVVSLLPTSGTTGRPKLVMQTHRAYALTAQAFPWWLGLTSSDRLITPLPLFHLNAQAYSTLGAIGAGASLILLEKFSARRFLDQARRYGGTQFNAIGAMLEILMRQPRVSKDRDHALRLCYAAPAPRSEERHVEIERRFGFEITAGYGLSESPFGMIWSREGPRPFASVGKPRQHPILGRINEARLVDDADRDVPPGTAGELILRNPALMKGYFGLEEETVAALRGGWLHTGDLMRAGADDNLYFVARKKEIIRRRGENIVPGEVEEALASHPAVAECAVIGVPSELTEEDVKAFVVLARGERPTPEELIEWCSERLASYKLPRYVEPVPELPRTSTGRIAKHLLPRERRTTEHDMERR